MEKQEALKLFNDGLEKTMNHPVLTKNREAKDLMKLMCTDAFELGWDICLMATKQASEKEIDDINKSMIEKLKRNVK